MDTTKYQEKRLIWNESIADSLDIVIDNIEDYYTFQPVNLYFNRVPEYSAEHAFYEVSFRNIPLDLPNLVNVYKLLGIQPLTFQEMLSFKAEEGERPPTAYIDTKNNQWNLGDPLPDCGFTYRGKPIIHLEWKLWGADSEDIGAVNFNRMVTYKLDGALGYAISNQRELCLSSLGIQEQSVIDHFLQSAQFKKLTTAMPKAKQSTLKSAVWAFSNLQNRCTSLDLRGLKFNRNTDVTNMLRYVGIDTGGGFGLQELILTPEQYALFSSTNCKHNTDDIRTLTETFQADKQSVFKAHNLADEEDMILMGRKLLGLEKIYKEKCKALRGRAFGACFFGSASPIDGATQKWEQLKQVIRIQPVDAIPSPICSCQLLEDDGNYYTYTPVNQHLVEVDEGHPDHVYYRVALRDVILDMMKGIHWKFDKALPDTGVTYRGKPVVSLSDTFTLRGLDTSLVHKYNVLKYTVWDQTEESKNRDAYLVANTDEADLSSIDLSNATCLRGFIRENQFKKIQVLQPLDRYESQVTLADASYAFFCLTHVCTSLDIRGLKFDRDTDVRGMLGEVSIAAYEFHGCGLAELILTPEQYDLFTAQDCMVKDRELERLEYNTAVHRQHVLDGTMLLGTEEESLASVERYWNRHATKLKAREYGSFFFKGEYDWNEIDTEKWEALKKSMVVKPL